MKIFLIEASKIDKFNSIRDDGYNSDWLSFLHATTNFDKNDFDNLMEDNGQKVEPTTFTEVLVDDPRNGMIHIDKLMQYNGAVVKNYPFIKNIEYSYWFIEKIALNNYGTYRFYFKLDVITTFGIKVFKSDYPIQINRKHIDYNSQFVKYNDRIYLHKNSILRALQNLPSVENSKYKYFGFFKNAAHDLVQEHELTHYYMIYNLNRANDDVDENAHGDLEAYGIISTDRMVHMDGNGAHSSANFERDDSYIIDLIKTNYDHVDSGDNQSDYWIVKGKDNQIYHSWFWETHHILRKSNQINSIVMVDYLPTDYIKYEYDGATDRGTFICDMVPKREVATAYNGHEADGMMLKNIAREKMTTAMYPRYAKKLFEFESPSDDWEEGTSTVWKPSHEAVLDFAPFKNIGVGYSTEIDADYSFSNGDLLYMPSGDYPLFHRITCFGPKDNTITDILSDYYLKDNTNMENLEVYENYSFKIKKDLFMPTTVEAWNKYNEQQMFRTISDFGAPLGGAVSGAAKGGVVGGPIGAAVGAVKGAAGTVKKMAGTVLKRQGIKNKPDKINGSASNILPLVYSNFDSRTLTLETINPSIKISVAMDFHMYGVSFFDQSVRFGDASGFGWWAKKRFNYLKISDRNIIGAVIKKEYSLYEKEILDRYVDGVTFWTADYNLLEYTLDYNYKNPNYLPMRVVNDKRERFIKWPQKNK